MLDREQGEYMAKLYAKVLSHGQNVLSLYQESSYKSSIASSSQHLCIADWKAEVQRRGLSIQKDM